MSRLLMEKIAEDKNKEEQKPNNNLTEDQKIALKGLAGVGIAKVVNNALYSANSTSGKDDPEAVIASTQRMLDRKGIASDRAKVTRGIYGPQVEWDPNHKSNIKITHGARKGQGIFTEPVETAFAPDALGKGVHIINFSKSDGAGATREANGLHEAGHAINYTKTKGRLMQPYNISKLYGAPISAVGGAALGARRAHVESQGKKTSRLSNFVDKHPYLSTSISSLPMLAEEGIASGRATSELIRNYGAKKGLGKALPLLPAFGTYAALAGFNGAVGGTSYKLTKKKMLEAQAKKKQNNNDLQNSNS